MHDEGIMLYICVFLFTYMISIGPISWIYAVETQSDIGLGISAAVYMFFYCLIATFKDIFIQIPCLHFLLAAFSLFAFCFVFCFVPETYNKSERAKKELFWPGAKFGRNLKPGEECKAGVD